MAEYEPDAPGAPGILAVDHVGIAVADLAGALALHTDVLGLRELHRERNPQMGVAEVMLGGAAAGSDQTQIQLLTPLDADGPIGRFLDRAGPGLHHVAYRVRNVDHAAEVLREKGFRLLYDSAKPGTRGSRINFVHPKDAGGVLIELVEPAAAQTGDSSGDPGGSTAVSAPDPGSSPDPVWSPEPGVPSGTNDREQA